MSLTIGQRVGTYEVTARLGAGGMGVVYRARDLKLKRDVALKVLPDEVSHDRERLARFQREAEVLAALNHPHIAQIYGTAADAIVMECVDGEDLSLLIARGPVPLDEAIRIAKQVADALEAAHDAGIVHRDLKPSNIVIRDDGTVKVLDFGLAKALEVRAESAGDLSNSPTITSPMLTMRGVILGTAAYMSPEQAKGRPADRRADIWAFGCVLFEMLACRRPFDGEDVGEVIAAVIRGEPDWSALPATTPATVRTLLDFCLQKDRGRRASSMGAVRLLLEPPATFVNAVASAPSAVRRSWLVYAACAALLAGLGIGAVMASRLRPAAPTDVLRFRVRLPDNVTWTPSGALSVSPDGKHVAFAGVDTRGSRRLWLRELSELDAHPLERADADNPGSLVWSPDSRYVAYWTADKWKRVDIRSGTVETICEARGTARGGSWGADGTLLFDGPGGIFRITATGGVPEQVTRINAGDGERFHAFPVWLPDQRHFLFLSGQRERTVLRVGAVDGSVNNADGILVTPSSVVAVPRKRSSLIDVLFLRDQTMLARPFDAARLQWVGEPVEIAKGVGTSGGLAARLSASSGDVLAYAEVPSRKMQLTWFDREGRVAGTLGEAGSSSTVTLSPDGTRAAAVFTDEVTRNDDIWIVDVASGMRTRLTFDPAPDGQPIWSPDARQILFRSQRNGRWGVYRKAVDGSGGDELLHDAGDVMPNPTHWSPDGRYVADFHLAPDGRRPDVWLLATSGSGVRPMIPFVENATGGRFSADSRWLSYLSAESGTSELYVAPVAAHADGTMQPQSRWLVSSAGSLGVSRWRNDGRELVHLAADGAIMSMETAPDATTFRWSPAKLLFRLPIVFLRTTATPGARIDAASDLSRFLVALPTDAAALQEFTVVMNWRSGRIDE